MNYKFLGKAEKVELLRARLSQLEAEHFTHQVNRRVGTELARRTQGKQQAEAKQMVADADAAQSLLDAARAAVSAGIDENK